jgi:hypothetical protein
MKTTFKIITGLFYLPFLAIAFVLAIIMFLFEMTVLFTYNQAQEWKVKMIIKADTLIKQLK